MSGVPVYAGPFGKEQAERLLWRAGFGARAGRGGEALEARPRRRRHVADAARPRRAARRPGAARRQGQAARAERRLRPRPPLVARPDGAHDRAARRADDARLARLVRDLEPGRRLAEADARPEPALPHERARLVRRPADRRDPGPGDARLAERQPERQEPPERELRARDDGALHARREPRRLHRDRRARAGARADRLARLGQQGRDHAVHLRPDVARPGHEDDLRPERQLRLAGRLPPLPEPPAAPVVLRLEALELLRPDRATTPRRSAGCRRSTRTARSGRSSRRSSSTRPSTPGRGW